VALQLQPAVAFIGRNAAMSDVAELLRRSRMVTISGAGGIGKTRLAKELLDAAQP